MKTFRSQSSQPAREALSRVQSLSRSAMSPLSLTVLLILTVPGCASAPADLQQVTTNQRQLLRQIDAMCSSYFSADLKFRTSDVLGELCVLMLVQKSKEQRVPENSKRTSQLHPLLHLVSQLHTRRERGLLMHAELQGPGGIESRGYFLYRPRNGRRSLEYE
ncbi:neuromedin-U [Kryptolebias marmoratus]|uniref:neuromedin-U n=1 Tax=Kryptolebias marmoratus TaxID=37003 RepID=UPI0007F8F729|nr:neuromedin-U [Kryptolebias marmoratus]